MSNDVWAEKNLVLLLVLDLPISDYEDEDERFAIKVQPQFDTKPLALGGFSCPG